MFDSLKPLTDGRVYKVEQFGLVRLELIPGNIRLKLYFRKYKYRIFVYLFPVLTPILNDVVPKRDKQRFNYLTSWKSAPLTDP